MNRDWGGNYTFVAQRPYKGKPEAGLAPGATVTLQILTDAHDHGTDKTGRPVIITLWRLSPRRLWVAVIRCRCPRRPVQLEGFIAEASYYIDYSPILRFRAIKKLQQQGGDKA